jgi:chemotaxis protein methyltransferase CheR
MKGPDAAVERAAALLSGRIGLRVEGSMRGRVARAVRDGAAARREPPEAYVAALLERPAELRALIDAITVQETGFFRDPQHFEVLVRRALPSLPGPGAVWSAGCANGQEAWSLAIALEEAGAADWRVLATDVSDRALERTQAGRYSEREVAGLSPARRALFLRRRGDAWEVGPRLRRRVQVLRHNLAEQPPPAEAGACRVVFCRNVLIYLDRGAAARALEALRARMPADGWLFLGAAEALTAGGRAFAPKRVDGTFVYRPRVRRTARRAPAADGPAAYEVAALHRSGTSAPGSGGDGGRAPGDGGSRRDGGPRRDGAPRRPAGEPALLEPERLLADGEAHAAAGRFADAATAFRKAAYLLPDDPVPLLGLGLVLEPDDRAGAERAFRAARAALGRAGPGAATGWSSADLERLLEAKLAGRR